MGRPTYRVVLPHRDPELAVELEAAFDRAAMAESLQRWTSFFAEVESSAAPPAAETGFDRRARRSNHGPRPRRVRSSGRADRLATVFRGEREIICYE